MADSKITALTALTAADPANDMMPIVDVSDTSMAASGTTKRISINNILACSPSATLASLNVTGSSIPANGLYLPTSNTLEFSANSLAQYRIAPLGVFTWYDGAGGTRMTLNSTGLGVGVSPNDRLTVLADNYLSFQTSTLTFNSGRVGRIGAVSAGSGNGYLVFETYKGGSGGGERMRIDSDGNVGVGVTPSAWGSGLKALQVGARGYGAYFDFNNDVVALSSNLFWTGSNYGRISASSKYAVAYYQDIGSGSHQWLSSSAAGTNGVAPTMNTNMVLDASGNLSVGATTPLNSVRIFAERSGGSVAGFNRTTSDGTNVLFYRSGSIVGDVSVTTTGTTFNSTSDYRLKESVAPMSGGLARVNALKPSVYKWKSNGSDGEGFLAHELAEVVPAAVNGEKDAVNEDGTIKAQSIDMSRIVPILVAAIKELTARVEALEA